MPSVPKDVLVAIQWHFHRLIRGRAGALIDQHGLAFPDLSPLLSGRAWVRTYFPIPGMNGGFAYWLECGGPDATLVAESWSLGVDGSGQRHEVTASGATLVKDGFI